VGEGGIHEARGESIGRKFALPDLDRRTSPLDRAHGQDLIWENVTPLFEAARKVKAPSFVYFVGEEDEGPVKIGVAKDPLKRLISMRSGNARHLLIEYVLVGDTRAEKLFHEYWEPLRIRAMKSRKALHLDHGTEWFAPEIRAKLYPIVAELAEAQVDLLEENSSPLDELSLIRLAHELHGYEPPWKEEMRVPSSRGYIKIKN